MEGQEEPVFNSLKTEIIQNSEKVIIQKDYRTIFLKEFTKELLFNIKSIDIKEDKEKIENFGEISERLRKKILEQIEREYEYKEMRNQKIAGIPKQIKPLPITPLLKKENNYKLKQKNPMIKAKEILTPQRTTRYQRPPQQPTPTPNPQQQAIKFNSTEEIINEIKKILNDPRAIMIECTGNNKFLLMRTAAKVMVTRIKLTEDEIKRVIKYFSKETKIPIVNGLLNAIKDTLSISAIISDVAGSRFLIKKVYLQS